MSKYLYLIKNKKKLKKVLTDIFLGDIVLLVLERGART